MVALGAEASTVDAVARPMHWCHIQDCGEQGSQKEIEQHLLGVHGLTENAQPLGIKFAAGSLSPHGDALMPRVSKACCCLKKVSRGQV